MELSLPTDLSLISHLKCFRGTRNNLPELALGQEILDFIQILSLITAHPCTDPELTAGTKQCT